eukprot:6603721-Prymnesium_polylepis.1
MRRRGRPLHQLWPRRRRVRGARGAGHGGRERLGAVGCAPHGRSFGVDSAHATRVAHARGEPAHDAAPRVSVNCAFADAAATAVAAATDAV